VISSSRKEMEVMILMAAQLKASQGYICLLPIFMAILEMQFHCRWEEIQTLER
jgi:hypothetical protein